MSHTPIPNSNPALAPRLPPLSLYIHIPWCVKKCPYCDFNSHAAKGQPNGRLPEADYVKALLTDLQLDAELAQGRPIQSIFFGGGTPSLFSGKAIGSILDGVNQQLDFAASIEITLEANPGTVEQKYIKEYAAAGVNRLSLGVQSFQNPQLQALGRIHSGSEALSAVNTARLAGIHNINIDLMHGLPGQTVADAQKDLQQAIDLDVPHISWYQLTIEQNTEFYKRPPRLPSEDTLADIQDSGAALLAEQGWQQYEISAYSKPAKMAQHNLNYWQFGDYLALGAGAHGKITKDSEVFRYWKTRQPEAYLQSELSRTAGLNTITPADLPFEFIMNGLRLNQGFSKANYSARTGLEWSTIVETVATLCTEGLLHQDEQSVRCTDTGQRYLNDVIDRFL